jgi:GT2 family glycosyltransferase
MRSTEDPVVTFLNPDVVLERSLLELVESCVEGEPQLVAGGLVSGRGSHHLGNARRPVTFTRELQRCVVGSRVSEHPIAAGRGRVAVTQVDGAFLMGSRDFLDGLAGFDERFELYFEDVDLCDRARAVDRVVLDTRCYGTHAGGRSSRRVAAASYCVFRVSRVRYLAKRAGARGGMAALVLTLVEVLARSLTRQPEGWRVRLRALGLVAREVVHPGTVRVLS